MRRPRKDPIWSFSYIVWYERKKRIITQASWHEYTFSPYVLISAPPTHESMTQSHSNTARTLVCKNSRMEIWVSLPSTTSHTTTTFLPSFISQSTISKGLKNQPPHSPSAHHGLYSFCLFFSSFLPVAQKTIAERFFCIDFWRVFKFLPARDIHCYLFIRSSHLNHTRSAYYSPAKLIR